MFWGLLIGLVLGYVFKSHIKTGIHKVTGLIKNKNDTYND